MYASGGDCLQPEEVPHTTKKVKAGANALQNGHNDLNYLISTGLRAFQAILRPLFLEKSMQEEKFGLT